MYIEFRVCSEVLMYLIPILYCGLPCSRTDVLIKFYF
jgi:hypothetical protein